jgi:hypothetical protein
MIFYGTGGSAAGGNQRRDGHDYPINAGRSQILETRHEPVRPASRRAQFETGTSEVMGQI